MDRQAVLQTLIEDIYHDHSAVVTNNGRYFPDRGDLQVRAEEVWFCYDAEKDIWFRIEESYLQRCAQTQRVELPLLSKDGMPELESERRVFHWDVVVPIPKPQPNPWPAFWAKVDAHQKTCFTLTQKGCTSILSDNLMSDLRLMCEPPTDLEDTQPIPNIALATGWEPGPIVKGNRPILGQ